MDNQAKIALKKHRLVDSKKFQSQEKLQYFKATSTDDHLDHLLKQLFLFNKFFGLNFFNQTFTCKKDQSEGQNK